MVLKCIKLTNNTLLKFDAFKDLKCPKIAGLVNLFSHLLWLLLFRDMRYAALLVIDDLLYEMEQ